MKKVKERDLKPNIFLKIFNIIKRILFVYNMLGALKRMFWICIMMFVFQTLWEGVIFTSIALLFQNLFLINGSGYGESSNFVINEIQAFFSGFSKEKILIFSFIFTALSVLFKSILNLLIFKYRTKFSTLFIYNIRKRVFSEVLKNKMMYFDNRSKGALMQMVINETRSCYSILKSSLDLTVFILMVFGYLIIMSTQSLMLTIIVLICISLSFFIIMILTKRIKTYSSIVVEKTRKLTSITEEAIGGIKQVKLLNYYKYMKHSFNDACWQSDSSNRSSSILIESQKVIQNLVILLTIALLVYTNWKYNMLNSAMFLAFIYLIRSLAINLSAINQKISFFIQNIPALDKIKETFARVVKDNEVSGTLTRDCLLHNTITYQNIYCSYGLNKYIIKNISLTIKKNQTIALVGESGSGKTTLVNLLVRLYDYDKGNVLIDDTKNTEFDLQFLRDKIGVVNQESILFNKSIKDNILIAKSNASKNEIINAAKNAYAHDFIKQLPKGYDTIVGDRGVKLSGGQRQRINIAQIFLKNPEILILDEATSALDSNSEQKIQQSIDKLKTNKTTIIIAHRLSTIKGVDVIYVLNNGVVEEFGSWAFLNQKKGAFYNMLKKQTFKN